MTRQIRVLEVIYRAERAGTETWLVGVLGHIDRSRASIDFLVHDPRPGAYDAEMIRRGARIFVSAGHRNLLRQIYQMWRIQCRYGPYDVVHSHVDYYGGFVALFARVLGVRARVVHSHNDTRSVDRAAGLPRRVYACFMKTLVRLFSTAGLGTSAAAAALMFGDDWQQDSRWRVMPACADMAPFAKPVQRRDVREGLRIPEDAIVFGHVGRFVEQKNHGFLIRVAEAIAKREKRARFLLVGGGDLRPRIERFIRERSLSDRFIVLAPRDDVPDLMLGAMDFFLFPSLYEGLGLALVEAQAAGLRCFASTAVPREAIAVPSLVTRLPLSDGPKRWADAILRIADTPAPISQAEALRAVRCRFDIDRSAEELVEFYRSVAS